MSIWSNIAGAAQSLGSSVGDFFAGFSGKSSVPEKSVAFTIGMIALGAKMAKADGVVTKDEVLAFKQVFHVPEKDMAAVQRVFDLAKQDIAGFESYAEQVARLFVPKSSVLENVLDGLFHIAKADHAIHERELEYLEAVGVIFGFKGEEFARIRARHVSIAEDPYDVLGVSHSAPVEEIRAAWRQAVRESHPDGLAARGLPEEAIQLAQDRLVAVNRAWEEISGKKAA